MKKEIERILDLLLDIYVIEKTNKILVHTPIDWEADTKESYNQKENLIEGYEVDNKTFNLFTWCDTSGFEYWQKQKSKNYVSIQVESKIDFKEISPDQILEIREGIIETIRHLKEKVSDQ